MRRYGLFLLLIAASARAAVVEKVSLTGGLGVPGAPAIHSVSGLVAASFTPALTPTALSVSLSPAPAPAPALLPILPAPAASARAGNAVAAVFAAPAAARVPEANRERGPPLSRVERAERTISETARSWSVPADKILADHDALVVGENHGSLASVRELTKALPGLVKAGVGVLGIEGLKRPSQEAVDAYLSGRADVLPLEVLAFSPKRREVFAELFYKARETGVRVVALGLPLDTWSRQAAELAAAKNADLSENVPADPGEQLHRAQIRYEHGYNEAIAEVWLTRRNRSMAGFLAEAAGRGMKAVALVGQNHVDGPDALPFKLLSSKAEWGSMTRELAALGLRAFSLTLTGGEYLDADAAAADRAARAASHAQAAQASPDGKPAYVPTGESTGLYHAGGRVPGVPASSRSRH